MLEVGDTVTLQNCHKRYLGMKCTIAVFPGADCPNYRVLLDRRVVQVRPDQLYTDQACEWSECAWQPAEIS